MLRFIWLVFFATLSSCQKGGFSGQAPITAGADALAPSPLAVTTALPTPSGTVGTTQISVSIFDATNKKPIAGATATLNVSGLTCTTNALGVCSFYNAVATDLIVIGRATGYAPQSESRQPQSAEVRIALSPALPEGRGRLVLTWSQQPDDLDSHFLGNPLGGRAFHVWYPLLSQKQDPNAMLDVDSTDGYGPETTSFALLPGSYSYKVVNFADAVSSRSNTNRLANCDAVVRLFLGSSPVQEFKPNKASTGLVWNVLSLTVDAAGKPTVRVEGNFTSDVDQYISRSNSSGI